MDTISVLARVPTEDAMVDHEAAEIAAARAQPAAFEPLYRRYRDRVYAYVRTRTPGDEDAADLTQQIFLRALDALPKYRRGRGPFVAWIFGIARHALGDFYRGRHDTAALHYLPPALHPRAEQEMEAAILQREALERLRRVFAALDADKRELLLLRFVAQLSIAEIAAVRHKSEAATQKQLYRLMQSLKDYYHDDSR